MLTIPQALHRLQANLTRHVPQRLIHDLCRDLGLGPELIAASEASRKNRFLFFDNRVQKLPGGPLGLLTTRLLSWRGKYDLIAETFRKGQPADDDESVATFFRPLGG